MTAPETSSRKLINSVQRAIDILGLYDRHGRELGTTEIAELLGLHKSTAAGLIYTLERNGFLAQNPATRKYFLGFRLVELGHLVLGQLDIRQVAKPIMEELRQVLGETVNLGVRDGIDVVYIDRIAGPQSLGMRREIGSRTALQASALGKALMAWLPLDELEELLPRLTFNAYTPRTIATMPDLRASLEETHRQGFAIDDEENEIGGRCVAAPIFDHSGRVVAAVSMSAPVSRVSLRQLHQHGARVREIADSISQKLGSPGRSSP